jgi:hypothetical protein
MDLLPVSLPFKIRPDWEDPKKYAVRYTFSKADVVELTPDSVLYRLPPSDQTFWTHFRFSGDESLSMDLFLITSNQETVSLTKNKRFYPPNEWNNTTWPLPSVSVPDNEGVFLRVHHAFEPGSTTVFQLVGFIDLFPTHPTYLLLSYEGNPLIMFQRNILNEPETDTIQIVRSSGLRVSLQEHVVRIRMND